MPLPKGFVQLAPGPSPDGVLIPGDAWDAPGRPIFVACSIVPLGPGGMIPVWPSATPLDSIPRWVMYGGPFDASYFAAVKQFLVEGWRSRGYWADVRRVPIAFNGTGGVVWPWNDFRWIPWQQETSFPPRWRYRQNLGNAVAWEQAQSGAEVAGLDTGALTDDVDPRAAEDAVLALKFVALYGQPGTRIGEDAGTWDFWDQAPKSEWWGYGDKHPFTSRDQQALVTWGNFLALDSGAKQPPNEPAPKAPPYVFEPAVHMPDVKIGNVTIGPPKPPEPAQLPPAVAPKPASDGGDVVALALLIGAVAFHRELGL